MGKWSRQRERLHWALVVMLMLGACVLIVLAVATSKPEPCVCQADYRVEDVNRDGKLNVVDVQLVVNAFLYDEAEPSREVLVTCGRIGR